MPYAQDIWPGAGLEPTRGLIRPPRSSVLFSTRWERAEARAVAAEFVATHFVWLYPRTRDFLSSLEADGIAVGTTLSAVQTVPDEGLARTLEGEALIAPWMQNFTRKAHWMSIASHSARTVLLDTAQRDMTWGADSIQFDDAALGTSTFSWGGDFSEAAVHGFGRWLGGAGQAVFPGLPEETRNGDFDYPTYLAKRGITSTSTYLAERMNLPLNAAWERFHLEEIRGFFATLRNRLHTASQPVTLTMNLGDPWPNARTFQLIDLADGVMGETSTNDLASAALNAATVLGTGAYYQPSLRPHDVADTRLQIAAFYALGAMPLVPWDVYMPDLLGPDKQRRPQPRYFGTPGDYADLYRFVRRQAALFDKPEALASVLLLCQVEHFEPTKLLSIVEALQTRQIPFAVMVAQSGYPAVALDPARIARAPAVIFASGFSELDAVSQSALAAAEVKRIRLDELDSNVSRLAAVTVQGIAHVLALPRVDPARPQELILHLIRNSDGPARPVTLQLNTGFVPYHKIEGIELFTLAKPDAQDIAVQGMTFSLSLDGEWAVLRIQLR